LDQVILKNEWEDQIAGIQQLDSSLSLGSDDKVIDGTIEVSQLLSAETNVSRASSRGQDANSGGEGVGSTINDDNDISASGESSSRGGLVGDDNGDGLPLVKLQDTTSRDGSSANRDVELTKVVVRVGLQAKGDIVGASLSIAEDATSESTRINFNLEGYGVVTTQVSGWEVNRLSVSTARNDRVISSVVPDEGVDGSTSSAVSVS